MIFCAVSDAFPATFPPWSPNLHSHTYGSAFISIYTYRILGLTHFDTLGPTGPSSLALVMHWCGEYTISLNVYMRVIQYHKTSQMEIRAGTSVYRHIHTYTHTPLINKAKYRAFRSAQTLSHVVVNKVITSWHTR